MSKLTINGSMFKRAGAWFGIFKRITFYGGNSLVLASLHGNAARTNDRGRIIDIVPIYQGRKIDFEVEMEPAELTVVTRYGNIRFTFADTTKMLIEGDPGLGLRFSKTMDKHETVHPRRDGAWEGVFKLTTNFIFKGLDGSGIDFDGGRGYWNYEKMSSDVVAGFTQPNAEGKFTLVLEEFRYGGYVRDEYPTYAEAKASMQAEWDAFYANMPAFPGELEEDRFAVQYMLWSLLTGPSGNAKHIQIMMFAGAMGSQWQMCQNAVALMQNPEIALSLLLGPFDQMSAEGQLADIQDDINCECQRIKPAVHGWAILQFMRRYQLLELWPREKVEELYKGCAKWSSWVLKYRDEDGSGLPVVFHGDESGVDDTSLFADHLVLLTPDTASYVTLLYEGTAKLAALLGHDDEAAYWDAQSKKLLHTLIEQMWDGEKFVALTPFKHEKVFSSSVAHYLPAMLGDRLPAEILDKLVDDLKNPETFCSPYGIPTENMQSIFFTKDAFGRGAILPSVMIFLCTGLWDSHRHADARRFIETYCNAIRKNEFPLLASPIDGHDIYSGTWPRCAYTILCGLLAEEK